MRHSSLTVRHVYLLAILPIMTYAAYARHLTRTDIKTMESTHGNSIIKSSLGLSKYSRTSPLLASLNVQRVESVINNQTINLLRRCLIKGKGSFYIAQYPDRWTAQSDLHCLPPLADLFIPTPTRLLREV